MGSLYCQFLGLVCTIHIYITIVEPNLISPEVNAHVHNHHD